MKVFEVVGQAQDGAIYCSDCAPGDKESIPIFAGDESIDSMRCEECRGRLAPCPDCGQYFCDCEVTA